MGCRHAGALEVGVGGRAILVVGAEDAIGAPIAAGVSAKSAAGGHKIQLLAGIGVAGNAVARVRSAHREHPGIAPGVVDRAGTGIAAGSGHQNAQAGYRGVQIFSGLTESSTTEAQVNNVRGVGGDNAGIVAQASGVAHGLQDVIGGTQAVRVQDTQGHYPGTIGDPGNSRIVVARRADGTRHMQAVEIPGTQGVTTLTHVCGIGVDTISVSGADRVGNKIIAIDELALYVRVLADDAGIHHRHRDAGVAGGGVPGGGQADLVVVPHEIQEGVVGGRLCPDPPVGLSDGNPGFPGQLFNHHQRMPARQACRISAQRCLPP